MHSNANSAINNHPHQGKLLLPSLPLLPAPLLPLSELVPLCPLSPSFEAAVGTMVGATVGAPVLPG